MSESAEDRLHRLHRLLQQALEVELFTIPPYLTALYSIIEGTNLASVKIIQSVVMEEMLHAVLVANVMNAVGARPRVLAGEDGLGPRRTAYPAQAPHMSRPLVVDLLPFSDAAVKVFMDIERPESPETDWSKTGGIETIGQLYAKLRNVMIAVSEEIGEDALFSGEVARQFDAGDYYGAGGRLAPVRCLVDALAAIDVIAEQGEGRVKTTNQTGDDIRFGQPKEVAHFYRFQEICAKRYYDHDDDVGMPTGPRLAVDWDAVRPIGRSVPTAPPAGFDGVSAAFEASYDGLLMALDAAFNGNKAALLAAVPLMQRLKVKAIEIMRIEISCGKTSLPPFWFMQS
ncbi:ferritin-like domain-containing protein [Novosphingobium sp.]|uniref:ferritin-like domain-containing protein n=1 Tax=Novosphingobium sp. TaxID=1874826 RepID=UPI003B52EE56